MKLDELYGDVKYLLGGGILPLLGRSLAERVDRTVIFQLQGEDLYVTDAFGVEPMPSVKGGLSYLQRRGFPFEDRWKRLDLDEEGRNLFPGGWRYLVLLGEGEGSVVVLLEQKPDDGMTSLLCAADGLIRLWRRYDSIEGKERALAGLSYMLYAAKSAFPSIFEPFPPDEIAVFLADVLRESFVPERLTLLGDDGGRLFWIAGDEGPLPARQGLFVARHLSPVPIPVDDAHRETLGEANLTELKAVYSVVLPLFCGERRFFYLLRWGSVACAEAVLVLELMGGVTSKAMAINALHEERERRIRELSEREFSLRALRQATLSLLRNDSVEALLETLLDVFSEITRSSRIAAVVFDPSAPGYLLWGERPQGPAVRLGRLLLSCSDPFDAGEAAFSCPVSSARPLLASFGGEALAEEALLQGMDRLLFLVDRGCLLGFLALSASTEGGRYGEEENLETLVAAAAVALNRCHLAGRPRREGKGGPEKK